MRLIKEIGMIEYNTYKLRMGIYECPYCLREIKMGVSRVKNKNIKSCVQCSHIHRKKKHNSTGTRLYKTWDNMRNRCSNKKVGGYVNYGGRGIEVCEEWNNSFIEFKNWALDNGYSDDLTIDRIDVDKNYEPLNCRFVSRLTQNRNTQILQKNNTSGYRGVVLDKRTDKWVAQITVNYVNKYLGAFLSAEEASDAYDEYVITNGLEHTLNKRQG